MNQLQFETSPYLLQHAHNPVHWQPWGKAALDIAKVQNKPILVSIGYSACHWCHVMERESFEDQETADLMNLHFINIKIDREERPDLDAIYMDAVQMISGSGGWPLNVFLTPEAKPFYGGTYFPPVNAYGRTSWKDVLQAINKAWNEKQNDILEQANSLTAHIQNSSMFGKLNKSEVVFSTTSLQTITENLLEQADNEWGGFGKAPKFPQTLSIQFLLRQHWIKNRNKVGVATNFSNNLILKSPELDQALLSIDKMIQGGIYDQLQGGFARYSTDEKWLAPHFEKMLYDNALLISLLCEAYQITKNEIYKDIIDQTMLFIKNEWQSKEGGFYSAYDADSEGVEGKYYVWEKKEIDKLLGDEAALFCRFFNISEGGNWEHTNILWMPVSLQTFCEAENLDQTNTKLLLEKCKKVLLFERNGRIKPQLDDKILLGWNALMITACCKAYGATGTKHYLEMGIAAEAFIQKEMVAVNGGFYHNYKEKAANPAFLDDYAFYIQALIHLQECTGNFDYLNRAQHLCEKVEIDFGENGSPFFFFTPVWQTDLVARKKDLHDGATPSGNSIMAANLFYLSTVFDQLKWQERVAEMLAYAAESTIRYPTSFGGWASLLQQSNNILSEVVVTGKDSKTFIAEILKIYLPFKVFLSLDNDKPINIPLFQNRWNNDKTQLFLCENQVCHSPVNTVAALFEQIETTY